MLVGLLVCGPEATPARALNFFELEVYPATTEGKGLQRSQGIGMGH